MKYKIKDTNGYCQVTIYIVLTSPELGKIDINDLPGIRSPGFPGNYPLLINIENDA